MKSSIAPLCRGKSKPTRLKGLRMRTIEGLPRFWKTLSTSCKTIFPKREMAVAERVHPTDVFRRESPIAKPAPSTGYFRGGRVGARPGAVHHWLEGVFLPTASLLVLAVLGILTVSQPFSVAAQIDLPEGTFHNVDVELNAPRHLSVQSCSAESSRRATSTVTQGFGSWTRNSPSQWHHLRARRLSVVPHTSWYSTTSTQPALRG